MTAVKIKCRAQWLNRQGRVFIQFHKEYMAIDNGGTFQRS